MKPAEVSVLLPFFNAEKTIQECIASILCQTFEDFEIVAIDDYSTDASAYLLNQFRDGRLRVIKNSNTKGLVSALNFGLDQCRSDFIARMDADDIMHPQRLLKQFQCLGSRPGLALVASQVKKFPESNIKAGYQEYIRWQNACLDADDIKNQIYIESPFAHPSVMFRKSVVIDIGAYRDGNFPEDYDLWLRMCHGGYEMVKIPEILLEWRESETRLSRVAPQYRRQAFDQLRANYLAQDERIKDRQLAYWGAGRKTRQRAKHLIEKGFAPSVWIDVDPRKIGNLINEVRVQEPAWLDREDKPFVLNYVSNHGARDFTHDYLESIGYKSGIDYLDVG